MGRRQFGSVRRLPSGRWQARYWTATGEKHTAQQTFATKGDAARFLARVQTEMDRGEWRDPRLRVNIKRLLVDYSLIGHGRKLALTLLRREREGVEVGSRVEVIGDSVPPRIAEVTAVSADEKVFEFAFAD